MKDANPELPNHFLEAVYKASTPYEGKYPNTRICNGVEFILGPFLNGVSLDYISALERKRGRGSEFILWLTDLADTYNVTLEVTTGAQKPYKSKELKAWYAEAGFESYDFMPSVMQRKPRSKPFTIPSNMQPD